MTDSTIENKPGDGGFDVGSSADELFGEIAEDPLETDVDRTDEVESDDDDDEGVEDQTAATVFGQLKDEVGHSETDELLVGESPEDIIASADEPEPEPSVDDDLLVDEEELTNLLLTERTKGEEFLWVDAGEDDDATEADGSQPEANASADAKSEGTTEDPSNAAESTDADDGAATETPRSVLETNAKPDEGDRSIDSGGETAESNRSSTSTVASGADADGPEAGEIEPVDPEFSDIEPEGIGFADSDSEDGTKSIDSRADAEPAETDETDDAANESESETEPSDDADDAPTGFFGRLRAKLASLF
ncbi:hypothetical protein AB7C87_04415 [Natrarchaeobius sp. A-rgal3]|uniref:hypothetical protein n=1 Tax=Natrarchaeobius versutus TaxID=1679078 RepID=UPI00350F3156